MPHTSLTALVALVMALGAGSCDDGIIIEYWTDATPPAVALQITAVNRMDAPVTLQMRHTYMGIKDGFKTNRRTYSDWITVGLQPESSRTIGEETVHYQYKNQKETMSGFILLDRSDSNYKEKYGASSSFEIEITMPPGGAYPPVYRLAGYKTDDWNFFREGIGDLKIFFDMNSDFVDLHHKGGIFSIFSVPYLIEAELIIDGDGTLAFNYLNVYNGGMSEDGFHPAAAD
ncbi:MAG: hypothetical protein LBD31_03655 [Treponema sp.]|jgi:hypothetical protein|nr:hypothetical protein [Treponema sp.]